MRSKGLTHPAALERAVRELGLPTATHRHVTRAEVQRARELAGEYSRLRILIDLLWLTGARISEVLALRVEDIDWVHQVVSVPTLKRRVAEPPRRGIPLPVSFLGPLNVYINVEQLGPHDLLIPVKRVMAWRLLRRVLKAAGVDAARSFPHAFRHGHALHALKEGVPINIVQHTLGHTSLLTTQHYLRATGTDIAHSYSRVQW